MYIVTYVAVLCLRSVSLRVSSDSDAIVGRYELFIDTIHRAGEDAEKWRHKHPDDIFLIFNPWHSGKKLYSLRKCFFGKEMRHMQEP